MDPWNYLKRDDLPTEGLKLLDLIERLVAETPEIDDQIGRLLVQYPELRTRHGTGSGFKLGRIAAIMTLNFLCRAYGRPDLGYTPEKPRRG